MRTLTIKCYGQGDIKGGRLPRTTLTFYNIIPDETMQQISNWLLTGKPQFGRATQKLTAKVITNTITPLFLVFEKQK